MRTATSSLGNFTATFFDEKVYVQERNVIRVHVKVKNTIELNYTLYRKPIIYGNIAKYTPDINGDIVIDLSDLLRLNYGATHNGHVTLSWGTMATGDYITIDFTFAGLINPERVIMPENQDADIVRDELDTNWDKMILLPSMIYRPYLVEGMVELYPTDDDSPTYEYGIACITNRRAYYSVVNRSNTINAGSLYINTSRTDLETHAGVTMQKRTLRQLDECKKYAAVRWVSFTGVTRVHTFEVHDVTQSTDEVIKLETLDGSYNQIKGRTDGFKLYLDELDTYDFWYYADVINSSKVEVTLDGETWEQVEVTTKSVTIPNSDQGALNKLEINVNWKNYDAVTM